MTLYVTGSAGFIGSNFIDGAAIGGVDRCGLDLITTSIDEQCEVLADAGPHDQVVLLGAHPEVDRFATEPDQDVTLNVEPIVRQMYAARGAGAVIVISSFGGLFLGGGGTAIPKAASPYFAGKLAIEAYAHAIFEPAQFAIARFANVYGPPGSGQKSDWRGVIPDWVQRRHAGQAFDVWGDLGATRDYVHVFDVCRALRRMLRMMADGHEFYLPVHLGTGILTPLQDLARLIVRTQPTSVAYTGGPALFELEAAKPGYAVEGSAIDLDRTQLLLDIADEIPWKPRSLEEGLRTVWDHVCTLPWHEHSPDVVVE